MKKLDPRIPILIKQIVSWLVAKNFSAIEHYSHGVRLNAHHLSQAVNEYGRALVMPPDTTFTELDAIQVSTASEPTWSININLWTQEEGLSDLTLECTVIDRGEKKLDIEIDNLHVL
jgi:hypothetical protein